MSKGPGRIERTIEELFSAKPDSAFTTDQLVERVYGNKKDGRGRKSRAVSIIRAAKKVCARMGDWTYWRAHRQGATLVFLNRASVMSYAIARTKLDPWAGSDEQIRKDFSSRGRKRHLIVKGGTWWRSVQIYLAERDGDLERLNVLRAEAKAEWQATLAKIGRR